jgi:hypothetical protein
MLCVSFVNGGYLNIESGLEQGLELGLEPGLEPKMTSSDLDGWKFTNSVLTFKELYLNLDYSFTNNAKCLKKFNWIWGIVYR